MQKKVYCELYGKELTFLEWIAMGANLLNGFRRTDPILYRHWERGNSVEHTLKQYQNK